MADTTDAPALFTDQKWRALYSQVGDCWDVVDGDGGVCAERAYIESEAKLMALTPQLVDLAVRLAPFSDVAQQVRAILGEEQWALLVGRAA